MSRRRGTLSIQSAGFYVTQRGKRRGGRTGKRPDDNLAKSGVNLLERPEHVGSGEGTGAIEDFYCWAVRTCEHKVRTAVYICRAVISGA